MGFSLQERLRERERGGGETERQGEKGGGCMMAWGGVHLLQRSPPQHSDKKTIMVNDVRNGLSSWQRCLAPPPLTPPPPLHLNFHLRIFGCLSSRTGRSLAVRVIEKECVWVIQVIASSPNEPGPPVVATLYMLSLGSRYRPATPPLPPVSLSLSLSPPPPPTSHP